MRSPLYFIFGFVSILKTENRKLYFTEISVTLSQPFGGTYGNSGVF